MPVSNDNANSLLNRPPASKGAPEGNVMNRWLARVVIAGVLVPFIGCSPASQYGSWVPPSTGVQADCERSGGVWRAAL